MIRVQDLTVRVPGFALDRVSFMVPDGGLGIVTGPTGAGKTTLVETIAGVRRVADGTITLGTTDVTSEPPEHRDVGLVYQSAWLFPHLSVRGNVAYGVRRAAATEELIERLQIAPLLNKPVLTLSGGERQLVALARALAREPRTLLLDEPFAAMDSALRGQIRATVLAWATEFGATTLLVTHDTLEAIHDGSVQIRLAAGRIRPTA